MKTVIQIIIEQRNKLSQNDFDTWILSNKKELLEKEKHQLFHCFNNAANEFNERKFNEFYDKTYNQNK